MGWVTETNKQYFENHAINFSYLKELFAWQVYKPMSKPIYAPTPAMLKGSALHYAVLQPELFEKLVMVFEGKRNTKEGKAEFANLQQTLIENPDNIILSASDYDDVKRMRNSILNDSKARELLKNTIREQSGYVGFNLNFLNLELEATCPEFFKIKADARKKGIIIDLKTTKAKDLRELQISIEEYHYDLQAYHYLRHANEIEFQNKTKIKYDEFWWIWVQNVEPFNTICYVLSDEDYKIGKHKWFLAYDILKYYYEQGINNRTLPCPDWKLKKYPF
jgi:hypothetical protein